MLGFGPAGPILGEYIIIHEWYCLPNLSFLRSLAAAYQPLFGVNVVFSILQSVAMGGAYGLVYLGYLAYLF